MPTNIVYESDGGTWVATGLRPRNPTAPNFVIVCKYGDWSGFRTLNACLTQKPSGMVIKPAGSYWIEER